MKKIAIIGGGITGLSTAFYLEQARRAGADLTFTLFEKSDRFGGALLTEHIEGCILEAGADSFLTEKPWAAELCQELGIADQLIGSNDAQRQTFILQRKKLTPLPPGMSFFVPTDLKAIQHSKLFSANAKKKILSETSFRPVAQSPNDISVADFVERHFGREMVERVADPLLAGIYGGDARQLSMQAVLPRFLEMEKRYGSLIRAMQQMKTSAGPAKPLFTSLKNGMGHLVSAIVEHLPPTTLRTRTEVSKLRLDGGKWKLTTKNAEEEFSAVIIATPAYATARLLSPAAPKTAKLLQRISYSSSATVALGFKQQSGSKALSALTGFGFLVPHTAGHRALACTFVHNKFPRRVPAGRALLRVFFGGVHDGAVLQLTDHRLIALARKELSTLLEIKEEPEFARVHRWPRSMPQYNLGHKELTNKVAQAAAELPRLLLVGSAFTGVGIPDCIRQGRDAARQLIGETRLYKSAT
jgi:oxygen-dependent protoporphyrinogen oxidase